MGVNTINEIEFDQSLSEFLNDENCEEVSGARFALLRSASTAGWEAAL